MQVLVSASGRFVAKGFSRGSSVECSDDVGNFDSLRRITKELASTKTACEGNRFNLMSE